MLGTEQNPGGGRRLTVAELTDYPVMAQALDNQWTPASAGSLGGGAPRDRMQTVREEFRRALVGSGTLLVNRAFLLNNEGVYQHFLDTADEAERSAFVRLLANEDIVPFLLYEKDPSEPPAFDHSARAMRAWQRLLAEEVAPATARFSWDDTTNTDSVDDLHRQFARGMQSLNRLNPVKLAEDLRIPQEQAAGLVLGVLRDLALWTVDQEHSAITRNAVYQRFITEPGRAPHLRELRAGHEAPLLKQLVDLQYNVLVPSLTQVLTATPPDSPPRSALQEQPSRDHTDPEALGRLLRGLLADTLQRAVDHPNSYGSLSLGDIVTLRTTEPWREYIDSLSALVDLDFRHGRLPDPDHLAALARQVSKRHARMLAEARRVSGAPASRAQDFTMSVALESPGVVLEVFGGGSQPLLLRTAELAATAGPLVIRLIIQERKRSGAGNLRQSITLSTLRLTGLRRDWKTLLAAYGGQPVERDARALPHDADQQVQDD